MRTLRCPAPDAPPMSRDDRDRPTHQRHNRRRCGVHRTRQGRFGSKAHPGTRYCHGSGVVAPAEAVLDVQRVRLREPVAVELDAEPAGGRHLDRAVPDLQWVGREPLALRTEASAVERDGSDAAAGS